MSLIKTTDGGESWTAQAVGSSVSLLSVDFVDAEDGWAVGTSGAILHTSDGGDTWQEVDNDASSSTLRGLSFVDADKGWLVGDYGTILTTVEAPYWSLYLPMVTRG